MTQACRKARMRSAWAIFIFMVTFSTVLSGCGDPFEGGGDGNSSFGEIVEPNPQPEPTPEPEPQPTPPPDLGICSTLNFSGVQWASRFTLADRKAFALALNISGSYEGNSGWANLTNNFDGQGLSMGLLNQTLGTGSLQPLLHAFRETFPDSYASVLTAPQRTALNQMLDQWVRSKSVMAAATDLVFNDSERVLIPLGFQSEDRDKNYSITSDFRIMGAAEKASVTWALQNLYTSASGRTFKTEWRTALKKLAAHPDYITLQVVAAEYLHDRALAYQERAGFNQLRGYLMLFDIAVQNGSITSAQFNTFNQWKSGNPNASTEQAMLKLIDIRAAASRPQYQEDVRRRKRTIVLGTGTVHGASRRLPQEYCYNPVEKYTKPNLELP